MIYIIYSHAPIGALRYKNTNQLKPIFFNFQTWFPATEFEVSELYLEEIESENAFIEILEKQFIEKLDVMGKLMYEKMNRLEEEINEMTENREFEPFENTTDTNNACSLCNAMILITVLKLITILLV